MSRVLTSDFQGNGFISDLIPAEFLLCPFTNVGCNALGRIAEYVIDGLCNLGELLLNSVRQLLFLPYRKEVDV